MTPAALLFTIRLEKGRSGSSHEHNDSLVDQSAVADVCAGIAEPDNCGRARKNQGPYSLGAPGPPGNLDEPGGAQRPVRATRGVRRPGGPNGGGVLPARSAGAPATSNG